MKNTTKNPQLFYFQESQILQRLSILTKTNMISTKEDDLAFVEIRNLSEISIPLVCVQSETTKLCIRPNRRINTIYGSQALDKELKT